MQQPNPNRPRNYKKRLTDELKKNSKDLYETLKNIIDKSDSSDLKINAENSINSIEELIRLINSSNREVIKKIVSNALRN